MRFLQGIDDAVEIGLHLLRLHSAQTVVAAKGDDDHRRVQRNHFIYAAEAVFGGVAADALVDDAIVISACIELFLEIIRVAPVRIGAVAGCQAVTKSDQNGSRVVCYSRGWL